MRKVLNMAFAWLMERISAEEWEETYKPIFDATPVDRAVVHASRTALKPKDESGRGALVIKRAKQPKDAPATVSVNGEDVVVNPTAPPIHIGMDSSGSVDASISPEA